jgi:hypothetical protein
MLFLISILAVAGLSFEEVLVKGRYYGDKYNRVQECF